jgi:serine/threonine-protein kinase
MVAPAPAASSVLSGRYVVFGEIASGGMASVLYGRLLGPVGFARPVAIKRLHPHVAREPGLLSMFIDEARICSRVSHANVVPTLDVIEAPGELSLVMEYVHGASLETLLDLSAARQEQVPLGVTAALMLGVLHGLTAAHEARSDDGELLGIVHRDVSPQNILVGVDGVPRLLDFGIAKARGRLRSTPSGEIKGKLLYMAPEQFRNGEVDLRVDVYGASAVLWEVLTGRTLFGGPSESAILHSVLHDVVQPPSSLRAEVSPALDAIVLRGLARDPAERYSDTHQLIAALERELRAASQSEVSAWVNGLAREQLRARAEWLQQLQRDVEGNARGSAEPRLAGAFTQGLATPMAGKRPGSGAWESNRPSYTLVRPRAQRLLIWGAPVALLLLGAVLWSWLSSAPLPSRDAPRRAVPAPPVVEPAASSPDSRDDLEGRDIAQQLGADAAPPVAAPEDWPTPAGPAHERSEPAHISSPDKPSAPARTPLKPKLGRNCREPYVIDAQGVKRWKPECL